MEYQVSQVVVLEVAIHWLIIPESRVTYRLFRHPGLSKPSVAISPMCKAEDYLLPIQTSRTKSVIKYLQSERQETTYFLYYHPAMIQPRRYVNR
jgi:hypothetical protein